MRDSGKTAFPGNLLRNLVTRHSLFKPFYHFIPRFFHFLPEKAREPQIFPGFRIFGKASSSGEKQGNGVNTEYKDKGIRNRPGNPQNQKEDNSKILETGAQHTGQFHKF